MKGAAGLWWSYVVNPPAPLLRFLCLGVLLAILIAGLEPFNPFPPNDVHWLPVQNGIRFGPDNGVVVSSAPIRPSSVDAGGSSLELWFVPQSGENTTTILTFHTAEIPRRLVVRQWRGILIVQHGVRGRRDRKAAFVGIAEAMHSGQPVFLTLVVRKNEADVYINGVHADNTQGLGLTAADFSGELALGTLPNSVDCWEGEIRGLAIYHRPLTPGEVSEHFAMWLQGSPSNAWNPIVLYKFDERVGEVAHSAGAAGPDLRLPSNFKLPHQRFLRMPWEGLDEGLPKSITSVFSKDVFTNIAGFIPFGFFFCLWFARRGSRRPVLTAVVLGSMLSLAIESLQWYLPTRDSDLTDFLTNTLGTVTGAGLFLCVTRRCRSNSGRV